METVQMTSLSEVMSRLKKEGYTEEFKVEDGLVMTHDGSKAYKPEEIKVSDFFRFEGESDPAYMDILYAIETKDGLKGILTDAYGRDSEQQSGEFFTHVHNLHKKHVY